MSTSSIDHAIPGRLVLPDKLTPRGADNLLRLLRADFVERVTYPGIEATFYQVPARRREADMVGIERDKLERIRLAVGPNWTPSEPWAPMEVTP